MSVDEPPAPQDDEPEPLLWLVVRSTPTDIKGLRPLAPGTVFWVSPDITVAPVDKWGRVTPDQDVSVSVTVQNHGILAALGVQATFWWVDPSTNMIPTPEQVIGTAKANIPAKQMDILTADKPWQPRFLNGGHECLYVQVECLGDLVTNAFRPDLDRHVAQRNVSVADPARPFATRLIVGNPFAGPADTQILVETTVVRGAARLLEVDLPLPAGDVLQHLGDPFVTRALAALGIETTAPEEGPTIEVDGPLVATELKTPTLDHVTEELLRQRHPIGAADGERAVGQIDLPERGAALVVLVAAGAPPQDGAAAVHHVRQLSNGIDVGGYTVIVPPL